MKTLSKDKLQEVANEVFERYPKAQKVAVTSDGQAFITDESDAAAKNHAKHNTYGKELQVHVFMRESEETELQKKKTAAELIAQIEAAESVEAVNGILGNDKRATVVAAAQKRIETLNNPK